MEKPHPAFGAPTADNGTVDPRRPPKRRRNGDVRAREYLTQAEVERLIEAATDNRNGHRDSTMVLIAHLGDVPNFALDCRVPGAAPATSVISFFKIASAKVS
jgi:hypothetical protein